MIYEGTFPAGSGYVCWGRRGRRHPFRSGDPSSRAAALQRAHNDGLRRSMRWASEAMADPRAMRMDAAPARKRGPVPTPQQRMYERMLLQRAALAASLVRDMVLPLLVDDPSADDPMRADALDPMDLAKALGIVRAIRGVLDTLGLGDREGVDFIGQAIEDRVTTSTDKDLSRLFTIPIATAAPSGLVTQWAETNAALITSIPAQYLDEIAQLIERGVREGMPIADVRDEIASRYGVTQSRASLIARDQTAKLTGAIQRHRHQQYGITQYIWSTSGDSRVRQLHADLDGTVQRYDSPPVADRSGRRGHPGDLWQCRCTARPIRPQDDVAALRAEAVARQQREAQILQQSPTVQGAIQNRSGFTDWNRSRLRELRAGGQRARRAVGL